MTRLIADENLHSKLGELTEVTEISDSSGRVFGHFTPSEEAATRRLYELAREHFDPNVSKQRLAAGGRYYTTAEVLAHLKSLEKT